jgi:hypothetical protein
MSLPSEFWSQLPLKTDEELYDIVAHQEDYLPEALAAAREEVAKRNLSLERTKQIEAAVQSKKAAAESKANQRLGWPLRILIFVFCAGLSGAILAVYYESKGYKKKASDCWLVMGLSFVVHFLLGGILYLAR